MRRCLAAVALCLSALQAAPAPVTLLTNSLLDAKGCLGGSAARYGRAMNGQAFQNDILLSHNGWQYTSWYDTIGTTQNVLLARRSILGATSGTWQIVDTGSDFTNGDETVWDAHNTISLGIDPRDGTLHLSWDHHGNTLRYRRSAPGLATHDDASWATGLLQSEQNWLRSASTPVTGVTYPIFFNAPDGTLFFNYRSGGSTNGSNYVLPWSPTSSVYASSHLVTVRTGTFTGPANKTEGTFTSTSRNAYANGWDFGPDGTLHYTWTWREQGDDSNHDICYAYSPDRGVKWYNNAGTLIADNSGSSGPSIPANISVASPGIVVVPLDSRQMLINQQSQTVDAQGRVHVVVTHRRQEPGYEWTLGDSAFGGADDAYHHYVRDPATRVWTRHQLPLSQQPGSRPDIEAAANGDLYAVFLTSGRLVIAGATATAAYADWTILTTEGNNYASEPRLDHARLRRAGILSVLMQENAPSSTEPTPVPIRVLDYALGPVFEAFAGQDRRLNDYDGDGVASFTLDGRVGATSGLAAASHRWLSGATVLATTAAPSLTLAVGPHTLTYEATANSGGRVATDTVVVEILPAGQITATASANDGNVPANTLDGNLATRWSASGLGQHITWDLGDVYLVRSLALAFYLGDQRASLFDLQSSLDGVTFAPLLSGRQSSGTTLQLETFDFPDLNTRYLRYVGQGNSQSLWNSLTEMSVARDAANFDLDADGLADDWEQLHFGSLAATPGADPDSDGHTNLAEFQADSDPVSPASTPNDTDADGLPDAWEKLYFTGLAQTPTGDPDGDALSNLLEYQLGTPPNSFTTLPNDADTDGLPDAWETHYFGNLTPSAAADPDGDGFGNLAEYQAGSLPNVAASHPLDSDGDGLPDALAPVRPYVLDDDTLHLWHLDERAPPFANAADPEHPLLGLLNGATAWLPGPGGFGTSINVNTGADTSRGIVTYAAALSSATTPDTPPTFAWHGSDGAFTFEALVKLDALPTGNAQIIGFEGDGSGGQDRVFQFRLVVASGAPALQFNSLPTGVGGSYTVPLPTSGPHAPDTSSWFHVAVTYDGRAGEAGNLKLYWTRLGSGATQANLLGGAGVLSADFDQTIHQGDFSLGNEARSSGGSTEVFPGRIDEVRISAVARGPAGFLFAPFDTDGDGLPDDWEIARFGRLDAASGSSDRDQDGTLDRVEWLLDTDPLSGASGWRLVLEPVAAPGGGFVVSWPARAGLRFRLERATDLLAADWATMGSVTALGPVARWTDVMPPVPRAFYRAILTPP